MGIRLLSGFFAAVGAGAIAHRVLLLEGVALVGQHPDEAGQAEDGGDTKAHCRKEFLAGHFFLHEIVNLLHCLIPFCVFLF